MPTFEQSGSAFVIRLGDGFSEEGTKLTIHHGKLQCAAAFGFSSAWQFVARGLRPLPPLTLAR
jgi:hypothetical protein